jgi:sec-independent protein translocase protein TatC
MSNGVTDHDDFFADTRMSFGEHLEDLRTHLWRAIKGFGIALAASFFLGHLVLAWITSPVKAQLKFFHHHRIEQTLEKLRREKDPVLDRVNQRTDFVALLFDKAQIDAIVRGKPADEVNAIEKPHLQKADGQPTDSPGLLHRALELIGLSGKPPAEENRQRTVTEDDYYRLWVAHDNPLEELGLMRDALAIVGDFESMTTLNVQEAFMVWFKVCMVCGFVLGSPWIFWQLWSFVAVGLYPHERRYIHVYLPLSISLFIGGVFVCEFLVIPQAIQALLWFNDWMGFKPDMRLSEWLGFAIFMPVVFGLSFQTPLVMLFFNRLGLVSIETFRNKRRLAWFAMAVFAAVITPSTDALSMLFLWVPMSLLFELGILLMKLRPAKTPLDIETPDLDGLVEA